MHSHIDKNKQKYLMIVNLCKKIDEILKNANKHQSDKILKHTVTMYCICVLIDDNKTHLQLSSLGSRGLTDTLLLCLKFEIELNLLMLRIRIKSIRKLKFMQS